MTVLHNKSHLNTAPIDRSIDATRRSRDKARAASMDESLLIVTENEILLVGLMHIGYTEKQVAGVNLETNDDRFLTHYGSSPLTCALLWEALQVTENEEALIQGSQAKRGKCLLKFLEALHWLRRYPTDKQREALFHTSEKTCREWGWYIVKKIAALKNEKVRSLHVMLCRRFNLSLFSRSFSHPNGQLTTRCCLS